MSVSDRSQMPCHAVESTHLPWLRVILHSAETVPRGQGLIGIFQIRNEEDFPRQITFITAVF